MGKIKIIVEKCTGCEKCLPSCPFSAIRMEKKNASILDNCNLCGACIDACPFQAIVMEKEEIRVDLSSHRGVWIFAEQRKGEIMPVTYELLGAGRTLANDLGEELSVVLLGSHMRGKADVLLNYDLEKIYLIEDPLLESYRTELYTQAIVDLVKLKRPEVILMGATSLGRDLAPRVATRLQTGLTADCTGLEIDKKERNLIQ
ncbi:MAG: 4Fe-4S binding protein, partial [bacterium]